MSIRKKENIIPAGARFSEDPPVWEKTTDSRLD